ncbi:MAG: TlpA family protein disulfide reductase [Myxococcales bacterium]
MAAIDITAPMQLTLPQLRGGQLSVASLQGSPAVLVFFATWAERAELLLPQAEQLARDPDVKVVAVALDEDLRFVQPFVERFALTIPVLLDGGGASTEKLLPLKVVPTVVVLDADGRVTEVFEEVRRNGLERLKATVRKLKRREASAGPP